MPYRIATGFNFGPLPDGNVRIEFHNDGGQDNVDRGGRLWVQSGNP